MGFPSIFSANFFAPNNEERYKIKKGELQARQNEKAVVARHRQSDSRILMGVSHVPHLFGSVSNYNNVEHHVVQFTVNVKHRVLTYYTTYLCFSTLY